MSRGSAELSAASEVSSCQRVVLSDRQLTLPYAGVDTAIERGAAGSLVRTLRVSMHRDRLDVVYPSAFGRPGNVKTHR